MASVRDVDVALVRDTVAHLLVEANYVIPPDILDALRSAVPVEESPLGRRTLEQLVRSVTEHGAQLRGVVMWETDDPVPTALSEADRAAGREKPLVPHTTEMPVPGSPA